MPHCRWTRNLSLPHLCSVGALVAWFMLSWCRVALCVAVVSGADFKTSHVRGREETDGKGCYHTSYVQVWRAILNWLERKEANT